MERDKNPNFLTTHWSLVLGAAQNDLAALDWLCGRYWYPVYAFVRRAGHDLHTAEDYTQGFFHFLIERQALHRVDREQGRFRTFMLTVLTNFLHNERDRQATEKRGGRNEIVSLEIELAEQIYALEISNGYSPEAQFDQGWAATLVRRVLEELRREQEQRGKAAIFAGLQPFLTGEPVAEGYERLGRELELEPGTVKVTLHRLRRRFGELLRHEVAHTVERPEDVEAELRHLLAAIAE